MPSKTKQQIVKPLDSKETCKGEQNLPKNWPADIAYLTDHTYSTAVTVGPRLALSRRLTDDATWLRIPKAIIQSPSPQVKICLIAANGQRGLFAAHHLEPDAFCCLYLGHVHTNALSDTDPKSDYDLNLDGEIGLSIDAARSGNESRCANDYRGIAERPNAEFRDCFIQVPCEKRKGGLKWERRVGIFVLSAGRAGKRKKGIAEGEEIVVSYGKGFWEVRKKVATIQKDEVIMRTAELALDA